MSALLHLPLSLLRFELETLEAASVPPYKGDLLRMALLWWLSEFWCPESTRCREGCRRPDICMFGRLCTPAVDSSWSPQVRKLLGAEAPGAYVLWDERDRRTQLQPGDPWTFNLTLIGDLALRQLPAIVAAVQQGAEQGMGRVRLRSRVLQASAQHPAGEALPLPIAEQREGVLTWQSYDQRAVVFGIAQAQTWAAQHPLRALQLEFLSPMKFKERGAWVETPEFSPLFKALVRRLRILSEVHGGGEWPHDEWGPLLDAADAVRLDHHETQWLGYARHSQASGVYDVEGFIGNAWYSGEALLPLVPYLWLGQWLHVGKGYVSGNGCYRLRLV
ncbi:MAG: hypothetical protein BWY63_00746 [Chloroflexi bacterium ADurb.Bin360]|nr:MAG: hypothetical protein BWY63_00746 [Chloroflexi bacterium ADurb.Bin360]